MNAKVKGVLKKQTSTVWQSRALSDTYTCPEVSNRKASSRMWCNGSNLILPEEIFRFTAEGDRKGHGISLLQGSSVPSIAAFHIPLYVISLYHSFNSKCECHWSTLMSVYVVMIEMSNCGLLQRYLQNPTRYGS